MPVHSLSARRTFSPSRLLGCWTLIEFIALIFPQPPLAIWRPLCLLLQLLHHILPRPRVEVAIYHSEIHFTRPLALTDHAVTSAAFVLSPLILTHLQHRRGFLRTLNLYMLPMPKGRLRRGVNYLYNF